MALKKKTRIYTAFANLAALELPIATAHRTTLPVGDWYPVQREGGTGRERERGKGVKEDRTANMCENAARPAYARSTYLACSWRGAMPMPVWDGA